MNLKKSTLLNESEDLEFLKSLKIDFFVEAEDSLEKAEASLLQYEQKSSDLDLMDYKRCLHSIKGSAKAVDESDFALCLHKIEDTINSNRSETFFEINFKFLDYAKNYIKHSKQGIDDANNDMLRMKELFK